MNTEGGINEWTNVPQIWCHWNTQILEQHSSGISLRRRVWWHTLRLYHVVIVNDASDSVCAYEIRNNKFGEIPQLCQYSDLVCDSLRVECWFEHFYCDMRRIIFVIRVVYSAVCALSDLAQDRVPLLLQKRHEILFHRWFGCHGGRCINCVTHCWCFVAALLLYGCSFVFPNKKNGSSPNCSFVLTFSTLHTYTTTFL